MVIADLPEPHRHLTCMAMVGRTGVEVFDNDDVIAGTPRTTATLSIGTAATGPGWFERYNTLADCDLREDGSHIQFGHDLIIDGTFPNYRIIVDRPGLRLDLDVRCTGQVTWFAHSPLYDHVGYPARYEGTLTYGGESQTIAGVLSLEHARMLSLTALRNRNIPRALKFPWNFFTYHVVQLDPDTTLMLASTEAFGQPVMTGAWLKELDGKSRRWVNGEVTFEVLDYRPEVQTAPDGSTTRLPLHFRWRIRNELGAVHTEIIGRTDTDVVYGVGTGWIGGYTYTGHHDGQPIDGTAYIEYVRSR
ncbi:DUF6670 family protein [Nocardioides phosphati]|uniref:DUF6670 family protein n=1 Tax=Nocardioides phosphati TaxID=1867775 RepID=UPI00166A32DA|nr:DUF6670 family protein [Nocardioides phosphati]